MDLLALLIPPEVIQAKTTAIYDAMRKQIREGNFTLIRTDDLEKLFLLYDQFFGGWLSRAVTEKSHLPLAFRLSSTMTRAGGKTITYRRLDQDHRWITRYEIAIASRMLFMTFRDMSRPVTVCGLVCSDRLQALQRIMEHEIIHLAELLTCGKSSCKKERFQSLALRIFGHTLSTHDLVTAREHAATNHEIRVGQQVEFEFDGQRHQGTVNRIHHRATVLVPSDKGQRYSDGKSYSKFYVPLGMLRVVEG